MGEIDLRTASPEQIAAVGPGEFIRIVSAMSDKDVKEVMASRNRGLIVDAIFGGMPQLFRAERAGSTNGTTHWSITGRPDGGADEWTVRFADGTCTTMSGHDGEPDVSLAMSPVDFLKIITKRGNPMLMVMTGKLKVRGDLGLAAGMSNFFDSPEP